MSLKDEVEETIYRFAWAYDQFDADEYVGTFLPDGVMVVESMRGELRLEGQDAIRTFFPKARGYRADSGQQPRHLINNIMVTRISDSEVESRCYMTFIRTHSDGSAAVDHAGRYLDKLTRIDGQWLFSERRILMDRDQDFQGRQPAFVPV
jgi:hypothetical protein